MGPDPPPPGPARPPGRRRVFEGGPTLIGHRGLGKGLVAGHEGNTLGSFLAALRHGVSWVEVDVRRSADDVLFVWHDHAYPDGAFLSGLTGDQADARGTLRLAELLAALPAEAGVVFDVKSCLEDARRSPARTTAALLAPLAGREARRRRVAVTSFDPGALPILRAAAPGVPLGLLTWRDYAVEHAVPAAVHLGAQVLSLHAGSLRPNRTTGAHELRPLPSVVSAVHDSGLQLLVWGPAPEHALELVAAGVDALVVDDVPVLVPALTAAATGLRSSRGA